MAIVWGYILEGAGRPARKAQIETLVALGAEVDSPGTIWSDKLTGRTTTRPRNKLVGRNDLIRAVMAGDTVVFHAPQCLGVSENDAAWLLGEMAARDVTVIVNGDLQKIAPGGDTSEVMAAMARWRLAKNMRTYRARKAK